MRAHHQEVKPTKNLAKALLMTAKNRGNPLKTMDAILQLPKDPHGNILAGIDNQEFELWNSLLLHIVPFRIFGPVLIPTDPRVIKALLSHLKIEPHGFQGNATSAQIEKLTGVDNIFSAKDPEIHSQHKSIFKTFLANEKENVKKAQGIVDEWINQQLVNERQIDDNSLSQFCSRIMIRFLLDEETANQQQYIDALIAMKTHFIALTVLRKLKTQDKGYDAAAALIRAKIEALFHSDIPCYVTELKADGYALDQIYSDVCSLLMVGFDNLRSALSSSLINLARHPEEMQRMRSAVSAVCGSPFVTLYSHVEPMSKEKRAGIQFFAETTRLAPPVWLQARKNGEQTLVIKYKNAAGEPCSFLLPARTNVLIPIFQMARQLRDGNAFQPERAVTAPIDLPFSTGPNACPGRNIALAAIGLVIGRIVSSKIKLALTTAPTYDPLVSFTLENITIKVADAAAVMTPDNHQLAVSQYHQFYNRIWANASRNQQRSVAGGLAVALITYCLSTSLSHATKAGGISAALLLLFFSLQQVKPAENNLDDIRCARIR